MLTTLKLYLYDPRGNEVLEYDLDSIDEIVLSPFQRREISSALMDCNSATFSVEND